MQGLAFQAAIGREHTQCRIDVDIFRQLPHLSCMPRRPWHAPSPPCRMDPAVTSVPFMTTIVDSTGLMLYFYIAKWLLKI